jgi:hypothetical protein
MEDAMNAEHRSRVHGSEEGCVPRVGGISKDTCLPAPKYAKSVICFLGWKYFFSGRKAILFYALIQNLPSGIVKAFP